MQHHLRQRLNRHARARLPHAGTIAVRFRAGFAHVAAELSGGGACLCAACASPACAGSGCLVLQADALLGGGADATDKPRAAARALDSSRMPVSTQSV